MHFLNLATGLLVISTTMVVGFDYVWRQYEFPIRTGLFVAGLIWSLAVCVFLAYL